MPVVAVIVAPVVIAGIVSAIVGATIVRAVVVINRRRTVVSRAGAYEHAEVNACV